MTTGFPALSYPQAFPLIAYALEQKKSVLLLGSPGNGKSSMARALLDKLKLDHLIDIRLSSTDPSELAGISVPNRDSTNLDVFIPDWLKQVRDTPCLLLLDEITAGVSKLHLSICLQILLDRRLGTTVFHPDTRIMAAGNLLEDRSMVTDLPDALTDRCVKFILKTDADAWLDWAATATPPICPEIRAYIAWKKEPALFHRYDGVIASPRSWTNAGQLTRASEERPSFVSLSKTQRQHLIAGCVGELAANEFMTFSDVCKSVDIEGLLLKGTLPNFQPEETALIYAFVFALITHLENTKKYKDATILPHLAAFFASPAFAGEYQVLFLKQLCKFVPKRYHAMMTSPLFNDVFSWLGHRLSQTF